ncbi:autotransporter assembly complex protein TamA [Psychromonas aquimarina]|uniref:autotransporter assembly complex protein TamA n=1 Tax=Psychromonas aquimarina TaxID=444919 RepID=UPI00048B3C5C|nr:autotransporter assembly complex family protein [Psychromonas aquimarina]
MNMIKSCFLILLVFFHAALAAEVIFEVNGTDDKARENIEIHLKGLSQPKNADSSGYLQQVEDSTREGLNALGYYQISMQIKVTEQDQDQLVTLNIEPGVRSEITTLSVKIIGEGKSDREFNKVLENFALKLHDKLHHGNYESAKDSLKSIAQRRGYFDAKFDKSIVKVTSKTSSAAVYLWFNTGPRYQFGELVFTTEVAAEQYIQTLVNFKVGDPYDSGILSQFNADLNETNYFKTITILPAVKDKQGLLIPLHVIAKMQPQDSFNVGAGFSTDEGVRGKFRWVRPWVNEDGHSIEGNLVASVPKQETSITYSIPLEDPLYNYFSIQSGYKHVDQNDTVTHQYLFGLNRHWRLSNNWLQTAFIRYDHENGIQGQESYSTDLILPGVSFSNSRSRGGINANWGSKHMFSLEVSNQWWLSSSDLVKVYGSSKFIRTYNEHQFVASMELGAIYADSINDVPSSMRFFTGGDQSIRGYDYEKIAPRDGSGLLIGGRYLTVGSLEYRMPVTENWKLALFTDAGTATNDYSEEVSIGAGAGVVWASPVGPIRLYIAKPLTETENSFTFHFMIGPEL